MMRLFLCKARQQNRSIVSLCEDFGDRRLVQKELIRTIFVKNGIANSKKKEGRRVCKQKITERCVNISKIKIVTLVPTTPSAPIRGKKSARLRIENRKSQWLMANSTKQGGKLTALFSEFNAEIRSPIPAQKKTHREMKFKTNKN